VAGPRLNSADMSRIWLIFWKLSFVMVRRRGSQHPAGRQKPHYWGRKPEPSAPKPPEAKEHAIDSAEPEEGENPDWALWKAARLRRPRAAAKIAALRVAAGLHAFLSSLSPGQPAKAYQAVEC
jgi:hypothetical protein